MISLEKVAHSDNMNRISRTSVNSFGWLFQICFKAQFTNWKVTNVACTGPFNGIYIVNFFFFSQVYLYRRLHSTEKSTTIIIFFSSRPAVCISFTENSDSSSSPTTYRYKGLSAISSAICTTPALTQHLNMKMHDFLGLAHTKPFLVIQTYKRYEERSPCCLFHFYVLSIFK